MNARAAVAVAALCGVLSALAFEPVAVPYLMILAVAGLLWLVRRLADARRRVVLLTGLVYGLAFMGPLIWWMRAVSTGAYVGLVIGEAVLVAVTVLGLRTACTLRAWPVWAASVWVLGEWVRGTFPFTGFPWGRLVHTTIDTPLASWVRLLGMPATSALLVLMAAGLVVLVEGSVRARVLAAAGVVGAVLVGAVLPTGAPGVKGDLRVAIVQGDVPGEFLTWVRGDIFRLHAAETQRLVARVESGQEPRPDLVLWPENSTDTDPLHDEPVRRRIEELSAALRAPILVGGLFDGERNDQVVNAGQVWTADGPGERYVKRKVVPYGEYVPFRDALGGLVPRIDRDIPRDMVAGDASGSLRVAGTVIGDTICYDIAYDGIVREALQDDAGVLVVQTSNAAFTGTSQPEQQWRISRLRAIETGRPVLVPSTNGISGVVDARGRVVEQAPLRTPATIVRDVPLSTGATPARVTEKPLEIGLVTLGLVGWVLGARRLRSARREGAPDAHPGGDADL